MSEQQIKAVLDEHGEMKHLRAGSVQYACACGAPVWGDSHRAHLASVLAGMLDASEGLVKAAALREAADHFDKFDEVWIGEPGETDIGSNMVPVPPAERLRNMADQIDGGIAPDAVPEREEQR